MIHPLSIPFPGLPFCLFNKPGCGLGTARLSCDRHPTGNQRRAHVGGPLPGRLRGRWGSGRHHPAGKHERSWYFCFAFPGAACVRSNRRLSGTFQLTGIGFSMWCLLPPSRYNFSLGFVDRPNYRRMVAALQALGVRFFLLFFCSLFDCLFFFRYCLWWVSVLTLFVFGAIYRVCPCCHVVLGLCFLLSDSVGA